ncbi:Mycobacterial persistence regulator MprA (Two component response transcriptional regulatory protein) [[Actinomadura] parvosata subsp. kistnae]|uniref:DNA-binding response regulator n=1 Tax=[Actinomadura] parvosata subsp. kistnae TaxID=1909395 RepID=A0A1U9ZRZ4_9ACTN|nr:response regulator transcription factor [Nonomuraea sp. ATCC 55076]AQZ60708.1 DNA-binding response regulator [Nonomuraea sp. ATCC 55076]SPL90685.1 Mycobacterial persistence regulator MprA (Two component response transcriptional regulatory protein) [Actinomadura parvosata subsp. kistnae]
MTAYRILAVDDDWAILRALWRGLRLEGFAVDTVDAGPLALDRVDKAPPDAIVLDVTLPGMSGVEVCARIRAAGTRMPVLMLAERDDVDGRAAALAAGADDCVLKPFDLYELARRLRALLRHVAPHAAARAPVTVGPLTVDPATRRVTLGGAEVEVTRREFDLLEVLARNAGIPMSRTLLLERVWGYDFEIGAGPLDPLAGSLRRKLEASGHPRMLHTVRGAGFMLREP